MNPADREHGIVAWKVLAILLGVLGGLGAFTMHYAKATSYLSSDPAACANCHIMQREFDGWQKSSHHAVAGCIDCHLPAELPGKLLAKGLNGYHHSKAFTLQNFAEPIRLTEKNSEILQDNCLRCHDDMLHDLVAGATTDRDAVRCVHCHAGVGHGEPLGLGGPENSDERRGRSR
jgi:cytochrome c nitrite reductase small subunit